MMGETAEGLRLLFGVIKFSQLKTVVMAHMP